MMALRYPTQPLRVAASSPTLSILHFVNPQDDARPPGFQTLVRDFANFGPLMTYTIIKDKKQIEHKFLTLIRARARCAIPMSLELHPVDPVGSPNPPKADQTIYRNYQMLNATIPKIAKEPKRKLLPINTEAPSNPKLAMEIFMK